jgi:hypothetical protein
LTAVLTPCPAKSGICTMRIPANPVFYDFEASRALDGFPIEIGWAFVDAAKLTIVAEGHLIRPVAAWDIDERWSDDAQALHGIDRAMLRAEGIPPYQIALHLNAALSGRRLFSDSELDEKWLNDLFEAAGVSPVFDVQRTSCETLLRSFAASVGISPLGLERLMKRASIQAPQTHRAQADATYWAWIWREVLRPERTNPA